MTDKHDEAKHITKSRSWLERLSAMLTHEPQNHEQLVEVLHDAENRGILSSEMLGMIQRILHVSEMQVREVMIPKAQIIGIEKENSLEQLLPIVAESGHSRFPVFDTDGNVVGILLAKDILAFAFQKSDRIFNINDIIRQPVFTPQSKRLDILLHEFRSNRNHLAVVLDEYGHVAGLVTIEDVLEQIVGEIDDEYDLDEDDIYIKHHADDTYIVKATTPIEEFNEYFNSDFSEEEFDTIGGIILQRFGHLPKRGESIKLQKFRFKVLQSDNRRVHLLEVKMVKKNVSKEG